MGDENTSFDVTGQLTALRRYARALTRDENLAEDLVHDALVRAYEGRNSFRSDGNLRTWLFSILHNVFVTDKRRQKAETNRLNRAAEISETESIPDQESRVHLSQIQAAFQKLPDEQRAALHLVTMEGLSYQEAAAALEIPLGTLMSRLGRARAALRSYDGETSARHAGRVPNLRVVGGSNDPSV